MSNRIGQHDAKLRRLIIVLAGLTALVVAGLTWSAGTSFASLRDRAFPIPSTQCAVRGNCDQASLKLQARETATAEAAMDIALGQLVVSILGVAGVALTIFYAHQAWEEAKRSADVAQDTAKRQLRAYVGFSQAEIKTFAAGQQMAGSIRFMNHGSTPARKVRAFTAMCLYPGRPDGPPDGRPDPAALTSEGTLWPGQGDKLPAAGHPPEQRHIDAVMAGEATLLLWGSATYEDIYGHPHTTTFCYGLTKTLVGMGVVLWPKGNDSD